MSNVAKLKKKAAEFEQKKQFDKALGVYLQILNGTSGGDEDVEVALYNRVGDLMLRQGNTADAVTYYEKAVDLYAEGGFFNNAIALCNKILRQSPGRSTVYYKLGKISAKKGFRSDAKQNFLEYADRMQQAGQIDEAFRALKEFADLVPDQEDVRLMLAEQLSRKDRKPEALEQLQTLYEKYEHEGRAGEAKATLDRMRALDPAFQPRSAAAPRGAEKPGDLVFLDVSWDGGGARAATPPSRPSIAPSRPLTPGALPPSGLTPAAPMPSVTPIAPPAYATPSSALETPALVPPSADLGAPSHATPSEGTPELLDAPELEPFAIETTAPVHGLSTTALEASSADVDGPLADLPLLGLETTAFDGHESDRPLTGSQFAALTLDEPAHASTFAVPEHDLVLPGELPSLGGDLEFIMPPADDLGLDSGFDGGFDSSFDAGAAPLTLDRPYEDDDAPQSSVDLPFLDSGDDDRDSGGSELTFLDVDAQSASVGHDVSPSELALAAELDAPLVESGASEDVGAFAGLELIAPVDDAIAAMPEAEHAPVGDSDAYAAAFPGDDAPSTDAAAEEAVATVDSPSADDDDEDAGVTAEEHVAAANAEGASTHETGDEAPLERGDESPAAPAQRPFDGERFDAESLGSAARPSTHATHTQAIAALRARVEGAPDDSALRRRLAELLLDSGDRDEGIRELERAASGYERVGDIDQARSVIDDVIRLQPNSVAHHQKRVEYAFRSNDRARLGDAYLELADALFRTGQADKARAVYERVIELSPDNARARSALNIVATPPSSGAVDAPPARSATPVASAPVDTAAEVLPGATAPVSSAPVPPLAAPAAAPSDSPFGAGDDSFVNLGDWLREGEQPKSTRMVTDAKEPEPGEEFDFAEMLAKFKQGVAQNVDEDDHESHYDLGVAFKEMGLVDEAISEFQKALRATARRTRTYEALGQCFLEQRQFQVASTVLQRALAEPGVGDEQLVGVLYLLGYAAEALGRKGDAVMYYERVFSVDIKFRDVTERLNALQQTGAR